MKRKVCISLTVLLLASLYSMGQGLTPSIKALVLSGQAAPGGGGDVFSGVGFPSINNSGTVAFQATLTPKRVTYGPYEGLEVPRAIYVAENGSISRLIGTGDNVPNKVSPFRSFGDPQINDSGQIAFVALIGPGHANHGVYIHTKTGFEPIALTGDAAPDTHGGTFTTLGRLGMNLNNGGAVAFQADFTSADPAEPGDGIFLYSARSLRAVVLRGQPAPVNNSTFDHFLGLTMNQSGQIAFVASLQGASSGMGVFTIDARGIRSVAIQGQNISGGVLDIFRQPSISDSGRVVFVHLISGQSTRRGATTNDLLVSDPATAPSRIASVKAKEKPTDPAVTGNIGQPVTVRMAGGGDVVLFKAWTETIGQNALFLKSNGTLAHLVKENDPSPAGGTFSFLSGPAITPTGRFAFVSQLKGAPASVGIFTGEVKF